MLEGVFGPCLPRIPAHRAVIPGISPHRILPNGPQGVYLSNRWSSKPEVRRRITEGGRGLQRA